MALLLMPSPFPLSDATWSGWNGDGGAEAVRSKTSVFAAVRVASNPAELPLLASVCNAASWVCRSERMFALPPDMVETALIAVRWLSSAVIWACVALANAASVGGCSAAILMLS